ncbi:hypothetical protein C8R45DRAFT_1003996 [Mycena sanguinolenta]|nr:hypothetical protein C8R45DRAFT_1003996 [Mycena sanguinolenta]
MAQNLPQEILDLVVGEFRRDDRVEKRMIAQCGLICRSWFPSSRYRLFSDVNVDDHTIISFLDAVDNSLFAIPIVIRSLGLSFSGRENTVGLDESLRRLGPLPLVVALRLTMNEDILPRSLLLLQNTFPNITSLVLRNLPLPLDSVLRTVSAFQFLRSVHLDWIRLSCDTPPPSCQLPRHWDSLTLDLLEKNRGDSQQFFTHILSLSPIPFFSSLAVREIDPSKDAPMGRYLAHVGNALAYLRLESGASRFFYGDDINGLKYCTGLRRLDLVFYHSSWITNTVLEVLNSFRSRNLVELNILDKFGSGRVKAGGWKELDAKLAEEQFAQLQTFSVQTKMPALAAEVRRRMPLAERRGILQVSEA